MIIGTSAGSVAGTDIASGQEPEAMYQAQLASPAPGPAARMGWGVIGRLLVLVRPDRAAVHAIGQNVLDVSRRAAAATVGRAQATVEAAAVRAVWRADGGPAAS